MSADAPPPLPGNIAPPLPRSHSTPQSQPCLPASATAAGPRVPRAPLVFGIINLCFAVSGIGSSVIPLFTPGRNPFTSPAGSDVSVLLFGIGSLMVVLQVAAAIGLIRLRDWARQTTVILAGLQVLISCGLIALFSGILTLPGSPVAAPITSTDPTVQKKMEFLNSVFGTLGTVINVVLITLFSLVLIYSLLQLIFLTRPRVREACRSTAPQP